MATTKDDLQAVIADIESAVPQKKELVEVRSYAAPPQDIKNVMAAVCIMLGVDPSWSTAKKLLANYNDFRQKLMSCKDNISAEAMDEIRKNYTNQPYFNPEGLKAKSLAAMKLCKWVIAIETYDRLSKGSSGTD